MYNGFLKSWNKIPFSYQTRQGIFNDCLFMNYNTADIELLNYDGLGNNFIERQAIKRQRINIINKFKRLIICFANRQTERQNFYQKNRIENIGGSRRSKLFTISRK